VAITPLGFPLAVPAQSTATVGGVIVGCSIHVTISSEMGFPLNTIRGGVPPSGGASDIQMPLLPVKL